jgi:hypothetical protein
MGIRLGFGDSAYHLATAIVCHPIVRQQAAFIRGYIVIFQAQQPSGAAA